MLAGRDPVNEDGKASGLYIPRFRNLSKETKHPRFIRGYGFECGAGTWMFPGVRQRPSVTRRLRFGIQEARAALVHLARLDDHAR